MTVNNTIAVLQSDASCVVNLINSDEQNMFH